MYTPCAYAGGGGASPLRRFLDKWQVRHAGFALRFLRSCPQNQTWFKIPQRHGLASAGSWRSMRAGDIPPASALIERTALHWLNANAVLRRTHHESNTTATTQSRSKHPEHRLRRRFMRTRFMGSSQRHLRVGHRTGSLHVGRQQSFRISHPVRQGVMRIGGRRSRVGKVDR